MNFFNPCLSPSAERSLRLTKNQVKSNVDKAGRQPDLLNSVMILYDPNVDFSGINGY